MQFFNLFFVNEIKDKINKTLFVEVDNAPLIIFRILFGLIIAVECSGALLTGWVYEVFVKPDYSLTFIGFEWLGILAGKGMYLYYAIMCLLGFSIMAGFFYKASTALFGVMWWGCYLMQKDHYNNHYYFLILLSFLMLIVPAHRYFSIDVKRNPELKSFTCPRWSHLIFIFQVGIVFTYAAIAKLYPDWLDGKPLRIWFSVKQDYAVIGPLLQKEWFIYFIAYSGVFFDLLIVPMLLYRRTRMLAFVGLLIFNIFNSIVFQIGIFPYLMIAICVFFFPPENIKTLFFKNKPSIGKDLLLLLNSDYAGFNKKIIVGVFIFYFLIQILLPLRHHLYEGNVHWTEEGHRMAWQMMLRTKSGYGSFKVKEVSTGKIVTVYPSQYFTAGQADEIVKRPDTAWQFAQFLERKYRKEGIEEIEVYADIKVSLNGGEYKYLINPQINLAKVPWEPFSHSDWILPY